MYVTIPQLPFYSFTFVFLCSHSVHVLYDVIAHCAIYVHPCAQGEGCQDAKHPRDGAGHQLHWTHPCAMAQHCTDTNPSHLRAFTHDHRITVVTPHGHKPRHPVRPPSIVPFLPEPSCPRGPKCTEQFLADEKRCRLEHKGSKIIGNIHSSMLSYVLFSPLNDLSAFVSCAETTAGKGTMINPIKDFYFAPNQPCTVTLTDGTTRQGWTRGREVIRTPSLYVYYSPFCVLLRYPTNLI
jgi:hypothetical protein